MYETSEAISKLEKNTNVATSVQEHTEICVLILKIDRMDIEEAQIFALYYTRQEIEQNFKFYDDTLDMDASFMQNHDAFEGWLFINHLALLMLYGILDYVTQAMLTGRYFCQDSGGYSGRIRSTVTGDY